MMKRFKETIVASLFSAFVASSTAAGAALPQSGAGSFDPLFGAGRNGRIVHSYADYYDYATVLTIQPDGKYLVSGYGYNLNAFEVGFAARYHPDGSPDLTFNGTGRRVFGGPGNDLYVYGSVVLANGSIVLAGGRWIGASQTSEGWMTRLKPDGSTDSTFASGGAAFVAAPAPLERLTFRKAAAGPDGKVYLAGSAYRKDSSDYRAFVLRLTAEGAPDPAFGAGGYAWLHALTYDFRPDHIAIGATGKVMLAGYTIDAGYKSDDYRGVAVRLNADGTPDAGFGAGGLAVFAVAGTGTELTGMVVDTDGSAMFSAASYSSIQKGYLVRLTGTGQRDEGFGFHGVVTLPESVRYASTLARQPDGKWVVGVDGATFKAGVLRLLPNGQPDPSFGAGTDFGYSQSSIIALVVDADGKIVIAGKITNDSKDDDSLVARMIGVEITTPVVEFHNAMLGHYFVTADPAEAAAIDAGAAGPGWARTGETFKSGGPNRVCRFYGNPEIDVATGTRRGPNSHFYTIEQAECAMVKTDAGWRFESHDFNGWPLVDGQCPQGTTPVLRAYNKRFAQNDSNHRYTTSASVYNAMLAQGWQGEGTVFCSAQ